MNRKKIVLIITLLPLIGLLMHGTYKYITEGEILGGTIFGVSLLLSYFLNHITWGDPNGISEESQDEMGQQITYKSFKVGYFVLIGIMFVLLIWTEEFSMLHSLNNIHNFPLFITFCSSFLVIPFVEFIVSRRYQ
ncbi:hypothetical protein V7183_19385 [Bacillus sp. JJ1127]|uniref:hypothetical protein n=1 Tax=Bacillus sp. JJ1127 TaxID=3122952 RepID=UPI002FFD856B